MKLHLSKKIIWIFLIAIISTLVVNSYFIAELNNSLRNTAYDSPFDYVIFKDQSTYKAKNQITGKIEFESIDASFVINHAIINSDTIHLEQGEYALTTDINIKNKIRFQMSGSRAKIIGNGNKILIVGENYTSSQYNNLFDLEIINSSLKIENSFSTTISSIIFKDCNTALEVANTNTWSEATKIVDSHFINCTKSIVFKSPTKNGTGSYASSEIKRCFFNLKDNSIAIIVENQAEFSDSQIQASRIWIGENGESNQTGLLVDGSMFQTLLWSVVFESFADEPSTLYGINIGESADPAPILSEGISFLGNWTAKIHNPYNVWISGTGGIFKEENKLIDIGLNNNFGIPEKIHIRPLRITSLKIKIQVTGQFKNNEEITVRIRLLFIDNSYSPTPIQKIFQNSTSIWLTDDDMLKLLSSQNIIWEIEAHAKSNSVNTNTIVQISLYGTTT